MIKKCNKNAKKARALLAMLSGRCLSLAGEKRGIVPFSSTARCGVVNGPIGDRLRVLSRIGVALSRTSTHQASGSSSSSSKKSESGRMGGESPLARKLSALSLDYINKTKLSVKGAGNKKNKKNKKNGGGGLLASSSPLSGSNSSGGSTVSADDFAVLSSVRVLLCLMRSMMKMDPELLQEVLGVLDDLLPAGVLNGFVGVRG
jgi:hypothetical protein